jgi:hypothetical protein
VSQLEKHRPTSDSAHQHKQQQKRRKQNAASKPGAQLRWRVSTRPNQSTHTQQIHDSPVRAARTQSDQTVTLFKGNSDPFSATPVSLSAFQYQVLSIVGETQRQQGWTEELAIPLARQALLQAHNSLISTLLVNTATTHAFFAYAWIAMANFQPTRRLDFGRSAQMHEVQAVHAMQPLISSIPRGDDATIDVAIMSVQFMACHAGFRADYAASTRHVTGLRSIIEAIGGLGRLRWVTRENIAYSKST